MTFWRKEVIDPALDLETVRHVREQLDWIAREPSNPRPYYHLGQLYRMQWKQDQGLGLLLEAVRLDPNFTEAHLALVEMYSVGGDYAAAWRHARAAEASGRREGVELLKRHSIPDRWEERYRSGENIPKEPLPLVERVAATVPAGRALDLACGAGRHALCLASHGWQVTAVDSSPAAIELLQSAAQARDLTVEGVVADLERGEFVIEPESFDLICDTYYLQRGLFPSIRAGVRRGGLALAVIPMIDDSPGVPPMNPDFLLREGELRGYFEGWELLHDHEGGRGAREHSRRAAELLARRP
ncbi:MAG: methyltransferase domain-containing protein [Bryobacteraceae bacterium]